MRDDRLLGGADHAVVEVLREDEVVRHALHVDVVVDVGRGIAGADAQGRLAGRVRGLDHAGAAGREDRGHAGMLHERAGRLDGRVFDPLHAVLRGTCLDGGVTHDARRFDGALLRSRVEAEDNRATGLEGDERLEDGSGRRVGHRGDACDDADRFCHFVDAEHVVFADDADGFLTGHVIGHVLAGEDVLRRLVFDESTTGLVDCQFRQHQMLVEGGHGGLRHDAIDGLLIELFEFRQRLLRLPDQSVDLGLCRGLLVFHIHSKLGRLRCGLGAVLVCHANLL